MYGLSDEIHSAILFPSLSNNDIFAPITSSSPVAAFLLISISVGLFIKFCVTVYTLVVKSLCLNLTSCLVPSNTNPSSVAISCNS